MTEEVFVKVIGTQYLVGGEEGEEEEPIELLTVGRLKEEDGVITVVYEEVFEGMEELPTTNTVRIEQNSFSVEKHGAADVTMIFEPGKMSVSPYETLFGAIEMGFLTNKLVIDRTEDMIHLYAEYTLSMNGENAADCVLDMTIEAKG